MKMKSSLSSPMTAINPPVGYERINLSLSVIAGMPAGVETRPAPKVTRPDAETRMRWPRRTTRPLFVQPLAVLSPRTRVLIWKKFPEPCDEDGCGVDDCGSVSSGGVLTGC